MTFNYTLQKSKKRKTIGLTVNEQGLKVLAPHRITTSEIDELLKTKAAWIEKALSKYDRFNRHKSELKEGGIFRFKGKKLIIQIIQSDEPFIMPSMTHLFIHTPDSSEAYLQKLVFDWLKVQAKTFIESQTHEMAALLGKTVNGVTFGKYKTKWGSCHQSGRIKFNWLLIQAPIPVIEYVIAHEVSHLIEMNHSPKFWAVVEKICPDFKAAKKWLKEHSGLLTVGMF